MARHVRFLALASLTLLSCGCLSRQFARDGASFQDAVCDIYTQQAMNNLIRAHDNLPFVQLKYSGFNVNDADEASVTPAVNQVVTTTRDVIIAAGSRVFATTYGGGATLDRKRTMSLNADPVTDQNDVYTRYLAFARDPSLFVVGDKPPKCATHICRKCGKCFYWVPVEAGPAFLDLVMQTALMRGPEAVPPAAYEVKILKVVIDPKKQPMKGDLINATLVFDKTVPNGEATMVADLDDGRRIKVPLWPVDTDDDGKPLRLGKDTTRLDIQWSPQKTGFTQQNLLNRPARIYSRDYPPEAAAPNVTLQKISTNVNQLRISVQNNRP